MTIQDLLDWCQRQKAPTHPEGYPLSAKLMFSEPDDGPSHELVIDGLEGHGHEWEEPEVVYLTVKEANHE